MSEPTLKPPTAQAPLGPPVASRDRGLEGLRTENLRLRDELRGLAREAGKNEAIFRRFQALELALLNAESLPDLLRLMVQGTREGLRLDQVTLLLQNPGRELRGLLQEDTPSLPLPPGVLLMDSALPSALTDGSRPLPWLGPYRKAHAELFTPGKRLGSVALLPLVAQGSLFGSLNLGSADPRRYTGRHARDFHVRLASIASLCLQNAMNRERLLISSHTDLLTRWHNRRYLEERLPQEVARALRYREPLCCLMLDLDHFKRINDRYGHPAGDAVLRAVAGRIQRQLRSSDLRVRYGGEELVVFLIRTTERDAMGVAERIRRGVAETPIRLPEGEPVQVTLSGGIAELDPGDRSADPVALGAAMLHRADAALYQAKAAGRDRIFGHCLR